MIDDWNIISFKGKFILGRFEFYFFITEGNIGLTNNSTSGRLCNIHLLTIN